MRRHAMGIAGGQGQGDTAATAWQVLAGERGAFVRFYCHGDGQGEVLAHFIGEPLDMDVEGHLVEHTVYASDANQPLLSTVWEGGVPFEAPYVPPEYSTFGGSVQTLDFTVEGVAPLAWDWIPPGRALHFWTDGNISYTWIHLVEPLYEVGTSSGSSEVVGGDGLNVWEGGNQWEPGNEWE